MTDKKSRRVVIINNIKSETIDQAIFILKSDKKLVPYSENSVASEAQNIINSYIRRVEGFKQGAVSAVPVRSDNSKQHNHIQGARLIAVFSVFGIVFLSMILFSYFRL